MGREDFIESIEVEGFRGLRRAGLDGFAGINILVGRNNSGKSTILEALYIAQSLERGLEFVVKRRGWYGIAAATALFHWGQDQAKIAVKYANGEQNRVTMRLYIPLASDFEVLKSRGLDVGSLQCILIGSSGRVSREVRFYIDGSGKTSSILASGEPQVPLKASFIDWSSALEYGVPEERYALMMKSGGMGAKELVLSALRRLYPDVEDIETLKVEDRWILHLVFRKGALPYYVVSDGMRHALAYLMALSSSEEGLLLLEEPELHMHPRLMSLVAGAAIEAHARRGNQVFISTHSLELIDMAISEAQERGLGDSDLKIYRLVLKNGDLLSEDYTLSEAGQMRKEIEWDLRS